MLSTFRTDGYRDAQLGNRYSPPAFSVHCREYTEGFNSFFECEADCQKAKLAGQRAAQAYALGDRLG